jgi:hypothetical protein
MEISINLLKETQGISCVENYYIALLRHLELPYPIIFYKSHLNFIKTVSSFLENHSAYLGYYELERVFVTGKDLGLLEVVTQKNIPLSSFMDEVENVLRTGIPFLSMVDCTKLPRNSNITPWREDHFVMVIGKDKDNLILLDDTPIRKLEIPFSLFSEAFMSACSFFRVLGSYNVEFMKNKISLLSYINDDNEIIQYKLNLTYDSLIYLRDAIGILRVSRKRIRLLLRWFFEGADNSYFTNLITQIETVIPKFDHLYAVIEAYRIRKKIREGNIYNLIDEIVALDRLWIETFKGLGIQ